jgi:hypothetical protein
MRSYAAPRAAPSPPTRGTLYSYAGRAIATDVLARFLAVFVAKACCPLSTADGPAMQELLQTVLTEASCARTALPSRDRVVKALLQLSSEHEERIRGRVAGLIAGRPPFPGQFAITMDAWSSRDARGYLGVTIAYIDDAWTLQSSVVACAPLPTPHTGEALLGALQQHLPLPAGLRHACAIVTDNGANFVRAAQLCADDKGLRCAAHTIQLVLKDVAMQDPLQSIVKCIHDLLSRVASSQSRREALADAAARASVAPLMPIHPAPTRWDSHYDSLQRFLQIYPALACMAPEDLGFRSAAEYAEAWAAVAESKPLVQPLCDVLAVFAQCTRDLQSATQVTLSRVPECVDRLLEATRAGGDAPELVKTIKAQLHDNVRARLPPLARANLVRIARFLDPVQFRRYFKPDEAGLLDRESAAELREVMRATLRLAHSTIQRAAGASGAPDDDDGLFEEAHSLDGWPAAALLSALRAYRDADKSAAAGPLDWWREHAAQVAPLDMIARWVLCIPATSAESERTFSLSGRIVSPLRTRLSGGRVHDLTLLASELRRQVAQADDARRASLRSGDRVQDIVHGIDDDDVVVVDEDDDDGGWSHAVAADDDGDARAAALDDDLAG